ncbi:hypothetical protein GCM10028807_52810 [Spirosoma daeguense]
MRYFDKINALPGLFFALVCLFYSVTSYSEDVPGVVIGMYEWSAQNLKVVHFRNGDPIPEAKNDDDWKKAAEKGTPAWCYYNNDPANASTYGVLYNWFAINDPRSIAPAGWDIPTREEVKNLLNELGPQAGAKLKSKSAWSGGSLGSNERGFGALPAGVRYIGGLFHDLGKYTYFWTNKSKGEDAALYFSLGHKHDGIDSTETFSFLKKGVGMSVRCVRRVAFTGYTISPKGIPNDGSMFIDNESVNRSGHYGSALTECKNGDILAFYTNVSGKIFQGHGIAGWSEYKRSTDGGKTWGNPVVFPYSRKVWDFNKLTGDTLPKGKSYIAAFVRSVITAPNGTLVAFLSRQLASNRDNYLGFKTPVYILSHDNGHTWTEPLEVDEVATAKEISLTNDDGASFVHDGVIYTVFIGGYGTGEYSLYASKDNGETFTKVSEGLFQHRKYKSNYYYMTAKALDDGRFIVYSYDLNDEYHLPYVISSDKGRTWSEVKTTYMAKRVRDAQMSEKIGNYYFMVGRSGSFGNDPMNLVLYASKNGIDWDNGQYLKKVQKTLDSYSAIEVIGKYDPKRARRVLIQGSVGYGVGASVNVKHWWIDDVK